MHLNWLLKDKFQLNKMHSVRLHHTVGFNGLGFNYNVNNQLENRTKGFKGFPEELSGSEFLLSFLTDNVDRKPMTMEDKRHLLFINLILLLL